LDSPYAVPETLPPLCSSLDVPKLGAIQFHPSFVLTKWKIHIKKQSFSSGFSFTFSISVSVLQLYLFILSVKKSTEQPAAFVIIFKKNELGLTSTGICKNRLLD
jgi:hypothetical protein